MVDAFLANQFEQAGQVPAWFANAVVFVLGSVVGSFLNVCIYRMPRDQSIVHPRSRCPSCGAAIPFQNNIPLISYVALAGRAKCCGAPFSIRYWVVELVTASFFLLFWATFPPALALCYLIFISLMIVATATDIEHYIIPNPITWGGIAAGIVCSFLVPELQAESSRLKSLGLSIAGFLLSYLVLWGVVELGKLVFGKKRVRFPGPTEATLTQNSLSTGDETLAWEDVFSRDTDRLLFGGKDVRLNLLPGAEGGEASSKSWDQAEVSISHETLEVGGESFPFSRLESLKVVTEEMVIPREAMGFGDVKFIGGIGAFLGPSSLFFVILVSSLAGSAVGLSLLALGKREWGGKLPYGPYLAFAAVLWVFFGPEVVGWWSGLVVPEPR